MHTLPGYPAVLSPAEEPYRSHQISDRYYYTRQPSPGGVEQEVESVHRIKRLIREVEVVEIHDMRVQASFLASLDHLRREVGADHIHTLILLEHFMYPRSCAEVQDACLVPALQQGKELLTLHQLPTSNLCRVSFL